VTRSIAERQIDARIGGRLREARLLRGITQERLADAVGLTFQQVQKYEKGANRIGASRLFKFSRILEVPPSFFFDNMPEELAAAAPAGLGEAEMEDIRHDPMSKRETLELVRAYYKIAEPAVRKRLFELVKAMVAPGEPTLEH
jgi:transcriptional regulator with XRE-family HTH domain